MMDMPPVFSIDDLPYAFGKPQLHGRIKQSPEDFIVEEIPGFEPEGAGDHVFLTIRKTNLTTYAVADMLKNFSGVPAKEIGYAGLKDRQAVTTQAFSVNMAGKPELNWQELESDQLQILAIGRHRRKLKRGVLKGNRFTLRVVDVQGDPAQLLQSLENIKHQGVPNFFGSQRFGRDGDNPQRAWQMLTEPGFKVRRDEKSILLSSVRSMMFNAVLAQRIEQNNWQQLLTGEVINLDGTERHFAEAIDDVLIRRAAEMDVHATAALPGKASRALRPSAQAGDIERSVLDNYAQWTDQLVRRGVEHARRPLRVAVRDLQWQLADEVLQLSFSLTSGAYATVVLRELLDVE